MKNLAFFETEDFIMDIQACARIMGGTTCTGGGFINNPCPSGNGAVITEWEGDCEFEGGFTVYFNSHTYSICY